MHSEIIFRINKVIDHIEKHLCDQHELDKLAGVANLSKFHFLRTFKIVTKETPIEYINRKRIERVASLLILNPGEKISDLSIRYGFQNLSTFSRYFKKHFGVSASQFIKDRKNNSLSFQEISNIGKTSLLTENYFYNVESINQWTLTNAEIGVRKLSEMNVAYVRHWGSPHKIHQALDKLLKLIELSEKKVTEHEFFILFHDNPSLTVEFKNQLSACVRVEREECKKLSIPLLTIPEQKYVVGIFQLQDNEFEMAWNSMVNWMNENNLRSQDGYRFERFAYSELFSKSHFKKVEIAIPIM